MSDAVVKYAKQSIAVGSLSFSLASKLLDKRTRRGVVLLYAFCRHADDVIDSLPKTLSLEQRLGALQTLREQTLSALHGDPDDHPVFLGLAALARSYDIPEHYLLELLAGMEMDIRGEQYATQDQLELYCYRVAGTVGLMFCHIAGISDTVAQRHACDLGIAMQLTNISRDVMEDAAMGRCYLPNAWLRDAGITCDQIETRHRHQLQPVIKRLLQLAEGKYRSGDGGIIYLPWRAALAASVARHVYHAIGDAVLRRGVRAWDRRTYIRLPHKLLLLVKGVTQVGFSLPVRLAKPFRPVAISNVWRWNS